MTSLVISRPEIGKIALADHVYNFIKGQLLEGIYHQDHWIPIDEVAAAHGVSRQPVMGALKRLAVEGLVTIVAQVGCRARRYGVEEAIDFYGLFAEGEALLARLAAERAGADDIVGLKIVSAQIGSLSTRQHEPDHLGRLYRPLNNRFHAELHRMARSPLVAATIETQRDLSDYFVAQARRPIFGERLLLAHQEHEIILAHVIQGDGEGAARTMRAHVLAITDRLRAG